jgi:hypothetical protein
MSSDRAKTRPPTLFEPPGSLLYHFTPLDTALKILKSGTLMMNLLSLMRDPRESQAWMPTVGGYTTPNDDLLDDTRTFATLLRDMNPGYGPGLRDRVKVLSFSLDDYRVKDDSTRTIYDWGFARPRLWEHYAARHEGVCLCFDRALLSERIREHLSGAGVLLADTVAYRNGEIDPSSLFFLAEQVRQHERRSDAQVQEHRGDLLFTKLRDWETEMEYRFAFVSDDVQSAYVPYANTLKAVVLGYAADNVYLPALEALCSSSTTEIFRVSWVNGFPRLASAR